jgi:hypothetical protein
MLTRIACSADVAVPAQAILYASSRLKEERCWLQQDVQACSATRPDVVRVYLAVHQLLARHLTN